MEPDEFRRMVYDILTTEAALGRVSYELTERAKQSIIFRLSLFVVKDIQTDEVFTEENVRSIRPGHCLHPRPLPTVIGMRANRDISKGTPLSWELL